MNKYLKLSIYAAIGASLGFAYYYFIGCNSGTCPITSNWHISTLYGAFMGVVAGFEFPSKKKEEEKAK